MDDRPYLPDVPPPKPKQRYRLDAYTRLVDLMQDAFWEPILRDISVEAALYGYCLLSGLSKRDAALVALGEAGAGSVLDAETLRSLDEEAAPVLRRGALAAGVNDFTLLRVLREVMEDPAQRAVDRLKAVELAAVQFLGKGTLIPAAPAPSLPASIDLNVQVTGRVELQHTMQRELQAIRDALSVAPDSSSSGTGLQVPRQKQPAAFVLEGDFASVESDVDEEEQ